MRTKLTKCCFLDVSNFCYVHKENLDSLSYQTSTFVQKEIYVVIMWKVYENCIFWESEVIPSSWWLLREKTHKRKEQKLQQKNHNNKRATVRHCPSLHLQFEKVLSVLDKTKSEHEICKSSKVKKRTTLCAPACRLLTIDKKKIPIISSKIWNVLLIVQVFDKNHLAKVLKSNCSKIVPVCPRWHLLIYIWGEVSSEDYNNRTVSLKIESIG